MRSLILLASLFYGCATTPNADSVYNYQPDSIRINMVREVLQIKRELDSIYFADSTLKSELYYNQMLVDTLLEKSLDYKDNTLELEIIKARISEIKMDKRRLVLKSDSISKVNEALAAENIEVSGKLNAVTKTLEKTSNELRTVYYKAAKFYLTGVFISGVGKTNPLIGEPKEYLTNKTGKIKKIKVSFTIPKNDLAKKENKNIVIKFYSIDNKRFNKVDTAVFYDGTEKNIAVEFVEKYLIEGRHEVEIIVNGEIETRSEIILAR